MAGGGARSTAGSAPHLSCAMATCFVLFWQYIVHVHTRSASLRLYWRLSELCVDLPTGGSALSVGFSQVGWFPSTYVEEED